MATNGGVITRKDIITDEALQFGEVYSKEVDKAIKANDKLVTSAKELAVVVNSYRKAENQQQFLDAKNAEILISQKAVLAIKEEEAALISAEKIKQESIKTDKLALAAETAKQNAQQKSIKLTMDEKVVNEANNKILKLEARERQGLVSAYEKLNNKRNEAQKTLGNLLSAEKQNVAEIIIAQKEYDKLDARVKAVDAAIRNYSKNIGNYQSAFVGLKGTLTDLMGAFGAATGLALFGTIVKDIFNVIKDFDRQLIAVGKTANISGKDLKEFGREAVELAGNLNGVSIDGLLKSAEVAGSLGVEGTANILKFSAAVEKLKLTSDIISDEQVAGFAKFIQVSSDSFENADRLASVFTRLGNDMAATEAEILANTTEIQKGVAVWNTASASIIGLGAATATLGSEAESSRSAIQTAFKVVDDAIASGKNLDKVLKLTNLSQKELSKQFNQDAAGVFVKFVGGLKKAKDEGQNLNKILTDVDITEKRAFTVIGSLAANYDVLSSAMETAKKEYVENVSLNKEVAAASESVSSILSDIKDKWEQYILTTNDANGGTETLAKGLKYLRDNLQSIISNVIKYGTVLLVFLGVQKAVNFITATWTALQTAATAAQIRFALSTGIGTKAILAQAEAARAAMIAQEGLNVAVKSTPWGIILALLSAVVVAYMVFNDTLSETEKVQQRINDVLADQKKASDESRKANEQYFNDQLKFVEDEFALKKAKQGNSDKLDKEEIESKKKVAENFIEVNAMQIQANTELLNKIKKDSTEKLKVMEEEAIKLRAIAESNTFWGNEVAAQRAEKAFNDLRVESQMGMNALRVKNSQYLEENKTYGKTLAELNKSANIKDAEIQAEIDKKALAAARKKAKELYEIAKKLADDEFKLRQFRLQVSIDMDNEILENEKANFDDRISALYEYQQLYEAKIRDIAQRELQLLGKYNEEKMRFERELSDAQISEILRTNKISDNATAAQKLIFETLQNNLTNSLKKGLKDRQKLIDAQTDVIKKQVDEEVVVRETAMNAEIERANKLLKTVLEVGEANKKINESDYTKGKTDGSSNLMKQALDAQEANNKLMQEATEEHEKKVFEIKKKYAIEILQLQADSLKQQLDENDAKINDDIEGNEKSASKIKEIRSDLQKKLTEISDLQLQTFIENDKQEIESWQEKTIKILDKANQISNELANLANALYGAKIQNIDDEIRKSDEYYANEIELAGNDQRKKDILQKEAEKKRQALEKKKREEQHKQAVFNKVITIAQIGLQTALAIIAATATSSPTFWAVAIASAIGAMQLAAAIATPIPKYKDGRKGGKAEIAMINDGGVKEVVTSSDGANPRMANNKNAIVQLLEGDIVHKSVDDYNEYLKKSILNSYQNQNDRVNSYQKVMLENGYSSENLSVAKQTLAAIKNQKQNIVVNLPKIDIEHAVWAMNNKKWNS